MNGYHGNKQTHSNGGDWLEQIETSEEVKRSLRYKNVSLNVIQWDVSRLSMADTDSRLPRLQRKTQEYGYDGPVLLSYLSF